MIKQITTIIVITALIFFGLGFVFANHYKSSDNTYQNSEDAVNLKLAEIGCAPTMEDIEITSISGIVKEIKGDKIYLEIQPLTPLTDSELDNRIIEVDENTKVYKLIEKSATQHQETVAEPMMLPKYFIDKEEISFSDIKAGQQITVTAQEDIKDVKEFKAIEVTLQFMPATETGEPVEPVIEMGEPAIIE